MLARERERKRDNRRANSCIEERTAASFLSSGSTIATKGNTLYMPTTFPKCNAQFFAATSARRVACDEGTSDSEDLDEADGQEQHARALSNASRGLRMYVCTYTRVCVHASATGSCDRITEKTTGRRKRGEGRREIYLPEFRRPPPMSFPRNAFRIQNHSRNMFPLRRIRSILMYVRSLLFHRWFRSHRIKSLQRLF